MSNKGFNLPITRNVPIEIEKEFNEREERDIAYLQCRDDKIQKQYNKLNSNLRIVADYIWEHKFEVMSYKQMSKDLGLSEGCIKSVRNRLNCCSQFPITTIPVYGNKGYIQSYTKNLNDTEMWKITKERISATIDLILSKVTNGLRSQKTFRNEGKIKQKISPSR